MTCFCWQKLTEVRDNRRSARMLLVRNMALVSFGGCAYVYWFSENRNFAFERVATVWGLRRSPIMLYQLRVGRPAPWVSRFAGLPGRAGCSRRQVASTDSAPGVVGGKSGWAARGGRHGRLRPARSSAPPPLPATRRRG